MSKNRKSRSEEPKESHNVPINGDRSVFGFLPYKRAVKISVVFFLIALVMSIFTAKSLMVAPPRSVIDEGEFMKWFLTSVAVPDVIVYVMGVAIGFYILPMAKRNYTWWLVRQTWKPLLIYPLIYLSLSLLFVAGTIKSSRFEEFRAMTSTFGLSPNQFYIYIVSMLSTALICWLGYKESWRAFRQVGAMTMNDRLREVSEKMYIKTSGQWWERFVSRPVRSISGRSGAKPGGGFLWCIFIGPLALLVPWTIFMPLESKAFLSFPLFFLVPASVSIIAAFSKKRDGRPVSRHVLDVVRDENTVDEYNTSILEIRNSEM